VAALGRRASWAGLLAALPRGGALPEAAWDARHRGIVVLLWADVAALVVLASIVGRSLTICVLALGTLTALAAAATSHRLSATTRATTATLGLLSSCAILIGLSQGMIEAHFSYFIAVAVVSLYQSWRPYLIAVGFVLAHHLVLGTLAPHFVYNHSAAIDNPWLFALVHGTAIVAESAACLVFWKVTEEALDAERTQRAALERTNVKLTAANGTVSDLVAMLSHDLRVPLTVLLGYSEMALESWPEMTAAKQVEFVRRVSRAGQSMQGMLEDTLAVSMLDGEGVVPRPVPVRVDEAVREALAALPGTLPAVDLRALEAVTACVDRGHFGQVVANLLTNAVKYGGGPFAVSTGVENDDVVLRITDHGDGVPESFVPHLFDRFTRSDEARDGTQLGTGLGLYISRSLLLANGGDISFERTDGGGATFVLHLPRVEPADLAAP